MIEALKRTGRRVVPAGTINSIRKLQAEVGTRGARKAFEAASKEPRWLDPSRIPQFQAEAPKVPPYRYDPQSLAIRGQERARLMRPHLPATSGRLRSLEIGASDAMVSASLARAGAQAVALDLDDRGLDRRATDAGVRFEAGSAMEMPFEDGSFDFAFTYNSFEHFADPEGALREALRVLRPGGVLYVRFAPLYRAAYGLHAFHAVRFPFCHYLFEREALAAFVEQDWAREIEFWTLNEWTIRQFRELFADGPDASRKVYREYADLHGMDLIERYPSCFRSETDHFEDLTQAGIEVALERR